MALTVASSVNIKKYTILTFVITLILCDSISDKFSFSYENLNGASIVSIAIPIGVITE
jgi:hypothetical protein